MSLMAWYKFNGNAKNYGVNNLFVVSNPEYYNSEALKIIKDSTINYKTNNNIDTFSFSFEMLMSGNLINASVNFLDKNDQSVCGFGIYKEKYLTINSFIENSDGTYRTSPWFEKKAESGYFYDKFVITYNKNKKIYKLYYNGSKNYIDRYNDCNFPDGLNFVIKAYDGYNLGSYYEPFIIKNFKFYDNELTPEQATVTNLNNKVIIDSNNNLLTSEYIEDNIYSINRSGKTYINEMNSNKSLVTAKNRYVLTNTPYNDIWEI